ncbi:DegT/DnrJ/EryC1/StrS family aminotransferase [Candidatus Collierbacteria bacterium]|nr:DegT/DnrJ/EryC1/StrS family aminotransferase [Candidatus Collierbacteria bacterium]
MIGGNLSLEPISLKKVNQNLFPENKTFWLQCGRGGLTLIIKLLGLNPKDEVLLPSYHCQEIVKPFLHNGIKCIYYPVGKNLQIRLADIALKVNPQTKLIVIIPYAGWLQKETRLIESWCQQKKIPLLKDNVPLVPEIVKSQPNTFQLYSFRKYAGVPSGAAMVLPREFNKENYLDIHFSHPKLFPELLQTLALLLRSFSHLFHSDFAWAISYKLYHLGETLFDDKVRHISILSYHWVKRIKWDTIIRKRRENANFMQQKLIHLKKITLLNLPSPKRATPLLFPIVSSKAARVKDLIRSEGIFATQLWPFPENLSPSKNPDSYWLTNNLLYLNIDQRYGKKEMDYQIKTLARGVRHD